MLLAGHQADDATAQAARTIIAETDGRGRGASALPLWGYQADEVAAIRAEIAAQDQQRRHQRQQQAILAVQMQDRQQRARVAQAQAQQAAQAHHHTLFAVAGSPFAAIDLAFPRAEAASYYALDPDGTARATVLRQMQAQQQQQQQQQAAAVAQERERQRQQQQQRRSAVAERAAAHERDARAAAEQVHQRLGAENDRRIAENDRRIAVTAATLAAERRALELESRGGGRPSISSAVEEQGGGAAAAASSRLSSEAGRTAAAAGRDQQRSDSAGEPTEIISLTSSSEDEESDEDEEEKHGDGCDKSSPEKEVEKEAPGGAGADEPGSAKGDASGNVRETKQAEKSASAVISQKDGGKRTRSSTKRPADVQATQEATATGRGKDEDVGNEEGIVGTASKKSRTAVTESSVPHASEPLQESLGTSQSSNKKEQGRNDRKEANSAEVALRTSNHQQSKTESTSGVASTRERLSDTDSSQTGAKGGLKSAIEASESLAVGGHDKQRTEEQANANKKSEAQACIDIQIAGPFVAGLLAGKKQAIETLEGSSVMAVHNATCKVFDLLQKPDQERERPAAKSTGRKRRGKSSSDDAVTLHSGDVERIAAEFVTDRRQVAKEAVQIAFLEMKKNHDTILNDLVQNFAREREELSQQMAKERTKEKAREEADAINRQEVQRLREQNAKLREEAEGLFAKHEKVREEAEKLRASDANLRERHRSEVADLKNENGKVVAELRKHYEESLDTLREEMEEEKISHSRALNAYMTASCSALRALRKNEEVSHMI